MTSGAARKILPVLPTTWRDGVTGATSKGPVTPVVMPSAEEQQRYGAAAEALDSLRVCGNCRFFDLKTGQDEMMRQRFLERLVRELDWKIEHLGAPLTDLGLCGMSNGEMVTSKMAPAHNCDQFRERA